MFRVGLSFLIILTILNSFQAAKAPKAVTVRTQMNVRDSDPKNTHFMQIAVTNEGKPVGIIVKKRKGNKKTKNQRKPKQVLDEVQEVVGVRVPDDADDHIYVYRNAQIVNNTLIMRKLAFS